MNELAEQLNQQIEAASPETFSMLSDLGKRIYFPSKGILSQSAEAKAKANRFNATIGTAIENGQAMYLDGVMECLNLPPNDALLYAPSQGKLKLRKLWAEKDLHDNPSLAGIGMSIPVVTNGLSHGLSLAGDMFVNPGDKVILPNLNWDNYHLNLADRIGAREVFFNMFKGDGMDIDDLARTLDTLIPGEKAMLILNFPNNPSGYTPTNEEGTRIAEILIATAKRGVRLVALIDDAYFSLFFGKEVMRESLFTKIAGKHPNLLAVKADAATKEAYVWGLRVGFITFAVYGQPSGAPIYAALEAKCSGIIRSTISNCSALSQETVFHALSKPDFYAKRAQKTAIMETRAMEVKRVLAEGNYDDAFKAYPFNSGYFMCIKLAKDNADEVRRHLLDAYGIGTICMGPANLRIAFSCLEVSSIKQVFDDIYKAAKEI